MQHAFAWRVAISLAISANANLFSFSLPLLTSRTPKYMRVIRWHAPSARWNVSEPPLFCFHNLCSPSLASSTSSSRFFFSTRQWYYQWHDEAPGNTPVWQVLLAQYKFAYLLINYAMLSSSQGAFSQTYQTGWFRFSHITHLTAPLTHVRYLA